MDEELEKLRIAEDQAVADMQIAGEFDIVRRHAENVRIHIAKLSDERKAHWRAEFVTLALGD
jgi:hypothetical protein